MSSFARASLLLLVIACDGGSSDSPSDPDGGTASSDDASIGDPDAAAQVESCVPSTAPPVDLCGGCEAGEKCGWITRGDDPFEGETACMPDGTVPACGECAQTCIEEGPEDTCLATVDDCAAGVVCHRNAHEIVFEIPTLLGDGKRLAIFLDLNGVIFLIVFDGILGASLQTPKKRCGKQQEKNRG